MDWSWLTNIFSGIYDALVWVGKFLLSHAWKAIIAIWQHLHAWYAWYEANVQKPMQAARQNFAKLYDQYILPILKDIDLLRRLSGLVGLFSKRLAAKLNLLFFRVEQLVLLPLQLYTTRVNVLSGMPGGFLTPLGFFDRYTLLNSAWRDMGLLRTLMRNPNGAPPIAGSTPQGQSVASQVQVYDAYVAGQPSPIQPAVDTMVANYYTEVSA